MNGHTASPTFNLIAENLGLAFRRQQDEAVALSHTAVERREQIIIQAPTGVGKSFVALATAADAGRPGAPGVIAIHTNRLGNQYLNDCARVAEAAGFTYTRVMGAKHYACADSTGARKAGVPARADVKVDGEYHPDQGIIDTRNDWLAHHATGDPAVQWELSTIGWGSDYSCPGYPDCEGNRYGGCGSKAARARSFDVDVVITNFSVLAVAVSWLPGMIPLDAAGVIVLDEAHTLPDSIAKDEFTGGGRIPLDPIFIRKVFRKYPELAEALISWLSRIHASASWGSTPWDLDTGVTVDAWGAHDVLEEWGKISPSIREQLTKPSEVEEHNPSAGILRRTANLIDIATNPDSTWRAWLERKRVQGEWEYDPNIHLRRVDAAADLIARILGDTPAVILSGTVGHTLPARLGLADVQPFVLDQSFQWSQVVGYVSEFSGVKSGLTREQRQTRDTQRIQQLAAYARRHTGVLVLANARSDAVDLARQLERAMPTHRVFFPDGPGSLAADTEAVRFRAHRDTGQPAVLVGVDSYATGLDLPGDLITFVAWWVCVPGASSYFDEAVAEHYRPYGNYRAEQHRSRFAQGIGRLLRSPTDRGEVMVCDWRAWGHVQGQLSHMDHHLRDIQWRGA